MMTFETTAEANIPEGTDVGMLVLDEAWMNQSVWPTAVDQAQLSGHEVTGDDRELISYERTRPTLEGHIYLFHVKVGVWS